MSYQKYRLMGSTRFGPGRRRWLVDWVTRRYYSLRATYPPTSTVYRSLDFLAGQRVYIKQDLRRRGFSTLHAYRFLLRPKNRLSPAVKVRCLRRFGSVSPLRETISPMTHAHGTRTGSHEQKRRRERRSIS